MDYKYILKHSSPTLLVAIFATMLIASLDGIVISAVISGVTTFRSGSSFQDVLKYSFLALIVYSLVMLSGQLNTVLKNRLFYHLNNQFKATYIQGALGANLSSSTTDEALSFLMNDYKLIESHYIAVLFDIVYYLVTGFVSMTYLLYLNPWIALLFIAFSFLPMLPPKFFANSMEQKSQAWSVGNEGFVSTFKSLMSGRRALATYGGYAFSTKEVQEKLSTAEDLNRVFKNHQSFVGFLAALLSWMSYIAPITCALYFVVTDQLEAGGVVAMFLASDRVIYPLRSVSMLMNQMNSTKDARKKMMAVMEQVPAVGGGKMIQQPDLLLSELSYSFYDESLLQGVNMVFNHGGHYLISGASGSGKTTLLDLIQGVLNPVAGRVFIRSGEMDYLGARWSLVARIEQNAVLFRASIRDNLTLGKEFSDEALCRVLRDLGLLDELGEDLLDKVYDDKIMSLSGGQKQRLEVARAIIHEKPIILVDEATAALDSQNAKRVRKLLYDSPATVIEVAHHFTAEDLEAYQITHLAITDKSLKVLNRPVYDKE